MAPAQPGEASWDLFTSPQLDFCRFWERSSCGRDGTAGLKKNGLRAADMVYAKSPTSAGREAVVTFLPSAARPLVHHLRAAFTRPTFLRWSILMLAAIVTTGPRTVHNLLRVASDLAPGHPSSYHRVLSHRRWSLWPVARALASFLLDRFVPDGPVLLAGDDTVDEHRGTKVYGKACHRDAVRSSHSHTAYRWGHKWVVLSILVRFPFASRPWALPVLVALYRSKQVQGAESRRHKTPAELMRQLLAALVRWFPARRFVLAVDGGYATHDLARFAMRHRRRVTMVSRFYPEANLYRPPPAPRGRRKRGRPPVRGRKLPSPRKAAAKAKRMRWKVRWYGGGHRLVEGVSEVGSWYRAAAGLVAVRWVFVHDLTGTHRDEYFFSTDPDMAPEEIVGIYTGRWNLETTFQEMRSHLGLETTRCRKKETILRAAPCLFGLYSFVALLYACLPASATTGIRVAWAGKRHVTFSDAIAAVRRWLWQHWIFETAHKQRGFSKIPRSLRRRVLNALALAA